MFPNNGIFICLYLSVYMQIKESDFPRIFQSNSEISFNLSLLLFFDLLNEWIWNYNLIFALYLRFLASILLVQKLVNHGIVKYISSLVSFLNVYLCEVVLRESNYLTLRHFSFHKRSNHVRSQSNSMSIVSCNVTQTLRPYINTFQWFQFSTCLLHISLL